MTTLVLSILIRSYSFLQIRRATIKALVSLYFVKISSHMQNIVSEYDQEIPQSQTADNPVAPRGRAAQPPRDTRQTNQAKQPALTSPLR